MPSPKPWTYESYHERKQRELQEFDTLAANSLKSIIDPNPMAMESAKQTFRARETREADQEARATFRKEVGAAVKAKDPTSGRTGSLRDRALAMRSGTGSAPVAPATEDEDGGGGFLGGVLRVLEEIDRPLSERAGIRIPELPGPFDEIGNFALEEATRPSTWAIAAGGAGVGAKATEAAARIAAGAAGRSPIRQAAMRVAELGLRGAGELARPALSGGLRRQAAGEIAASAGARLAGEQAANLVPDDAPGALKVGAAILGGVAGGAAGARTAGGLLRGSGIDAAIPGRDALNADAPDALPPVADNKLGELFGLREVTPELSDRDRVMNLLRETVTGGTPADERVTPFMRERQRLLDSGGVLDSYAAQVGDILNIEAMTAFDFEGVGIPSLRGIDPELGDLAPTLADVAAKLPMYADRLSPQQAQALQNIADELRPLYDALTEQGIELHSRGDIIEGGFYIPRGRADLPGEEVIYTGSGGKAGSKMGAERSATFESQAQGVAAGYEYQTPGEAIKDYVRTASERALDEHTKNYLRSLDEAWTAADDPALRDWRARMDTLRAKISTRLNTIRRQDARLVAQEAEAGRAARTAEQSRRLALSAETRAMLRKADTEAFEVWMPDVARDWLPEVDTLRSRADSLRGRIKLDERGRPLNTAANRSLMQQLGEVEALTDIRSAADAAGDDYQAMLDAIEESARRASQYTDEISAREMRGGANRAPAFGTQERVQWEADRRGDTISGGRGTSSRRAGPTRAPRGEKPFEGPDEAIRVYENTLSDALSSPTLEVSRTASPDDVIKAADREMRILDRVARKAESASDQAAARAAGTATRQSDTMAEVNRLRAELDALRPEYEQVKRRAQQTPRGMAGIQMSGLESYRFPDRIAAAANAALEKNKPLQGRGAAIQNTVLAVNRLMRMLNATMDVSFMGIQGLLGAVTDPEGYGQAMRVAYDAARDPKALGAYLRTKDPDLLKQMVRDGVRLGGSNLSEFTTTGMAQRRGPLGALAGFLEDDNWMGATVKLGGRTFEVPGILQGRNPIRGANRMFGTFGDVMRVELYEALTDVARASGLDVGDAAVRASIANSANLMTGTGSRAFLGDDVGGLAVFAPRYLQAQLDLVGKALTDGKVEGALARRTLTRLLGAAVGLTVAANTLLGEDTVLDPSDSNFLRIRIGGHDVSLLGPWDSLLRASMNAAEGDVGYIARSKASPVISRAWDLFSGEDFVGNDTRNPGYVLRSFLPFSMQDITTDDPATTVIGLTGLKASPMSPTDRLDAIARMDYGADFYDLEPQYQEAIRRDHPDVWEDAVENRRGAGARSAELKLELRAQQEADDALLLSGGLSREDWRAERGRRLDEHRIVMRELYGDERPSDEEAAEEPMAHYAQAIHDATDPATGRVDWDAVDVMRATSFTDEENRYIDENTGVWNSELSQLYRDVTREYYSLPQYRGYSADEARAINDAWTVVNNRAREIAAQYGREPDQRIRAAAFGELRGSLGVDERVLRGVRQRIMGLIQEAPDRAQFRQEHPEVDALLGSGPLTATEQQALAGLVGGSPATAATPRGGSLRERARQLAQAGR